MKELQYEKIAIVPIFKEPCENNQYYIEIRDFLTKEEAERLKTALPVAWKFFEEGADPLRSLLAHVTQCKTCIERGLVYCENVERIKGVVLKA